ncbi:uncharacterized protein EV420DRAFT_344883 [Desarmillaria tabescens]|uniref:Uncharacterized protein n=1 Tax=Armillaria tabescens TaxID=1929756 RepID=A0AA39KFM7_ARMTA|nr:uncharacterized protein EV420DRAFT_344883 [Desarmillaria tabescens]KAK0458996.1 hypothetical protein EV420DRAFT_344883 [Desarmillaria tabescens]
MDHFKPRTLGDRSCHPAVLPACTSRELHDEVCSLCLGSRSYVSFAIATALCCTMLNCLIMPHREKDGSEDGPSLYHRIVELFVELAILCSVSLVLYVVFSRSHRVDALLPPASSRDYRSTFQDYLPMTPSVTGISHPCSQTLCMRESAHHGSVHVCGL